MTVDRRRALAEHFVAMLISRDGYNIGTHRGANTVAEHACDLADQLDQQFTARGWEKSSIEWIDCSEHFPEFGDHVLGVWKNAFNEPVVGEVWRNEKRRGTAPWTWFAVDGLVLEPSAVTHWQPMPAPPTKG